MENRADAPDGKARSGIEGLVDDIAKGRAAIGDRNALYQTALEHVRALIEGPHEDAAIVRKLERAWQDRTFTAYYDRPLLLLASLRNDALVEGPRHPLWPAFGSDRTEQAFPESELSRDAIRAALSPERLSVWLSLATRRVQTNEVSRGVTWLWPAHLIGCSGGARSLALVDVGCAAGLNLMGDDLPLTWFDAHKRPIPTVTRARVAARIGFDSHPLDLRYDDDALWLRACTWAGDVGQLQRLDRAVAALRSAYDDPARAPQMYTLQAPLVPSRLAALRRSLPPATVILAYQSFLRGYIEPERANNYARAMKSWLDSEVPGRALWVECEMDGTRADFPAAIIAHARARSGEVETFRLAECEYYPATLLVDEREAERLAYECGQYVV